MGFNSPSDARKRNLHPSPPLSFQITFQGHYCIVCISVGQEIKAQGKLPLSQAAPCQNNAVSIWSSNCGKSLILLKHAYITHCQSVFRVHRTPLASDPESINDGIDFTRTNPVNEGCGIDPLVIASGNKEEFSGNTNYFNWVSCSQTSHLVFLPCHHDIDSALTYAGFIDWDCLSKQLPQKRQTYHFFKYIEECSCFTLKAV